MTTQKHYMRETDRMINCETRTTLLTFLRHRMREETAGEVAHWLARFHQPVECADLGPEEIYNEALILSSTGDQKLCV